MMNVISQRHIKTSQAGVPKMQQGHVSGWREDSHPPAVLHHLLHERNVSTFFSLVLSVCLSPFLLLLSAGISSTLFIF